MNVETENDIDSDMVTLIPLQDELNKCDNFFSNDENFESKTSPNRVDECLPDTNVMEIECEPSTSKCNFQVCKEAIASVPEDEQDEGLEGLGVSVYDQTQFENDVMDQVDKAMKAHEEKKRKEEVERELQSVADDIR